MTTPKNDTVPPALDGPPACGNPEQLLALAGRTGTVPDKPLETRALLQQLLMSEPDQDGARLLAHALPMRRAVWWGVLLAWHGAQGEPDPEQNRALEAAVQWVRVPSEAHRRAAHDAAEAALLDNAPGCCARAACQAGAMTPNLDKFLPGNAVLAARLVADAVGLVFVERTMNNAPVSYRSLLQVGLEVFEGKNLWET